MFENMTTNLIYNQEQYTLKRKQLHWILLQWLLSVEE